MYDIATFVKVARPVLYPHAPSRPSFALFHFAYRDRIQDRHGARCGLLVASRRIE